MQKNTKSWKLFLLKRFPLYTILVISGFVFGMLVIYRFNNNQEVQQPKLQAIPIIKHTSRSIRQPDFELIKPLLLTEDANESDKFQLLKEDVLRFINKKKQEGIITSASVYMRSLNEGYWMSVNKNELFSPGSLMKIPTMIVILKEAEKNPGLMERKILFRKRITGVPQATITGVPMTEGTYYSISQLLYYMIVNSDNDATGLLNGMLDFNLMRKLFTDLQLNPPANGQKDYLIDVADCAKFLTILYNATYLNPQLSEYALRLLTESVYREGIIRDFDPSVKVAHKFGERNINGEQQLHEFGIIYINKSPYLLGIMTKGTDNTVLSQVLSGVSGIVFKVMSSG